MFGAEDAEQHFNEISANSRSETLEWIPRKHQQLKEIFKMHEEDLYKEI